MFLFKKESNCITENNKNIVGFFLLLIPTSVSKDMKYFQIFKIMRAKL